MSKYVSAEVAEDMRRYQFITGFDPDDPADCLEHSLRHVLRVAKEHTPRFYICALCEKPTPPDEIAFWPNRRPSKSRCLSCHTAATLAWHDQLQEGWAEMGQDVVDRCQPYLLRDVEEINRATDEAGACPNCGRLFYDAANHYGKARTFCSTWCADAAKAARRKAARAEARSDIECDHCGDTFDAARSDAVYCSSPCRQAAYRQRQVQHS